MASGPGPGSASIRRQSPAPFPGSSTTGQAMRDGRVEGAGRAGDVRAGISSRVTRRDSTIGIGADLGYAPLQSPAATTQREGSGAPRLRRSSITGPSPSAGITSQAGPSTSDNESGMLFDRLPRPFQN